MCGIAGILNLQGESTDRQTIQAMSDALSYRGPDDAGTVMADPVSFGHRRLSIIDLTAAGHQPMRSPDGRYLLVFNGEIYNFKDLKRKYCRHVPLVSASDTEVLLHCLIQKGQAILPELKGMFAFAFWDCRQQCLLLARDPFGKKPLYYAHYPDIFIFASEIKAILRHPRVTAELDKKAAVKFLYYEYVPAPATGYQHIQQLAMGSYAQVDARRLTIKKWWRPPFNQRRSADLTESEALRILDDKLHVAVQRRLVADVPVGLLLSGGMDSTTIGWYIKEETAAALHSFSVSFSQQAFNESRYAVQAARCLGTRHHDVKFGLEEFHRAFTAAAPQLDIPFGDSSFLPTYVVCEAARNLIKVALDGDGSDELLGGYGNFRAAEIAAFLPALPPAIWQFFTNLANRLPTNYDYFSFDFKLKSFLRALGYKLPIVNQNWLGSFSYPELQSILTSSFKQYLSHLNEDMDILEQEISGLDVFNTISDLTINQYLTNDILVKLDRASMLNSLEARTPFLDIDLAEFIIQLPVKLKRNKYLLRRLMRGRIPDEIIDRPKQGFALPLGYWLKEPLYEWARSILSPASIGVSGLVEPAAVEALLAEHHSGRADHRKKLWTLIMFQVWYDKYINKK